jgi:hypothetical protein
MKIRANCEVLVSAFAQMKIYSADGMVMGNVLKQDLTTAVLTGE